MRKFDATIKQLLEAVGDVPPPPPAIVQHAVDNKLSYDDILNLIKKHEGVRPRVYKDSLGIPTVGIGFNLLRPDAPAVLNKISANYNDILSGKTELSNQQMQELFNICLKIAYADAKKYIPSFDSLPKNIKLGLLDMSFNLGYGRLSKFVKTREHILNNDYKSAAAELQNSKWAKQVGNRSASIISLFLNS